MAEVSPMMTHEAGAGPKVNRTETMRPREACAKDDAVVAGTQAAIPRATEVTGQDPGQHDEDPL